MRFSPVVPVPAAARLTALAGGTAAACTPTATFASAVPSGEGETCRVAVATPAFSAGVGASEGEDVEVGYVFGVEGWRGCEGGDADDLRFEVGVDAFAGGAGVGAGVEEGEADADVEAALVVVEFSDFEGMLNSAGRTCDKQHGYV